MSEQKPELSSAETGSAGTPAASEAALGPVQAAAEIESPGIAPNQEETAPKADAPKVEAKVEPKIEPKIEPKLEAPKAEAPKVEASKPEAPRIPGNVTIMSPGDRKGASAKAEAEPASGKRRVSAMAAVVAMAAVAGAPGRTRVQWTPPSTERYTPSLKSRCTAAMRTWLFNGLTEICAIRAPPPKKLSEPTGPANGPG